jgi:haloalkane dehalogenase
MLEITRRNALTALGASIALPVFGSNARATTPPNIFRTPESRFANVSFAGTPAYVQIEDVRIAYYTAGPANGEKILLMHGNPSWAYLYHEMVPGLVAKGYRVILPDLVGFGRSDKPLDPNWYSYARIVRIMAAWFRQMSLGQVNLFCQDWGGLIGLRIVDLYPAQFKRVITSNTALPKGDPLPAAFFEWRDKFSKAITAAQALEGGTVTALTSADVAAYDAPFPTAESRIAQGRLPQLVPENVNSPEAAVNLAAYNRLKTFPRAWVCLWGQFEPYTAAFYERFRHDIAGARLPSVQSRHTNTLNAGHFIQEDQALELVNRIDGIILGT